MQLLSAPMTPRLRLLGLVCALSTSSLAGCGAAVTRLAANNDEYLAYRNVRTSERIDDRLAASHAYLTQHPDGHWEKEIRPWYERAELRYWLRIKETPSGLATYLRILPDGPHASEARATLASYRERQRDARKELLDLKAATTEERLSELARQREDTQAEFTSWLGRFLSIDSWAEPTSSLEHAFIFAWRIDPPKGTCVEDRCAKLVQRAYEIPGGGDDAERLLVMDVVLQLEQGMLREARLEGPSLFSRLFEASTKQPVRYDSPTVRVDAIAYAIDMVGGAVEARLPRSRCSLDPTAPVVLHRECDGWAVKVVAAENPGDEDIVSISGPGRRASP